MAEVRDIVTDALKDLGIVADGEVPPASEVDDGLVALNGLMDQWAAERLTIYRTTRTTWTLVPSTQTYTLGTSGTINVARPVFLDRDNVKYIDTAADPDAEYPLGMLTDDAWAALTPKAQTGTLPSNWHYNPTFPLGTLTLWPNPTSSGLSGALYAPQQVAEFTSVDDVITLPPGYRRMLRKNLAVELAPSYRRQIDPELRLAAAKAMAVVKAANRRTMEMSFDSAVLSGARAYDIMTGQ